MKLYEIDKALENIIMLDDGRGVDVETGEIIDRDALNSLAMKREDKIENCLLMMKNLKAEAEAIKAEIDSLTERKKAAEKRAEWLKEYVANSLGGETFETARVKVSYRKSYTLEYNGAEGKELEVTPIRFLKETAPKIDKDGIKKALKAGEEIPGYYIAAKMNLQVK